YHLGLLPLHASPPILFAALAPGRDDVRDFSRKYSVSTSASRADYAAGEAQENDAEDSHDERVGHRSAQDGTDESNAAADDGANHRTVRRCGLESGCGRRCRCPCWGLPRRLGSGGGSRGEAPAQGIVLVELLPQGSNLRLELAALGLGSGASLLQARDLLPER